MKNGLVIRYFSGSYCLCKGKAPEGRKEDGEIYVGDIVGWFPTWDEADKMRKMISDCCK